MYQQMLVPLDGSEAAETALREAIGLARVLGARLHLLHVLEDYPWATQASTLSAAESAREVLRRQGSALLDQARQQALDAGLDASTTQDDGGAVTEAILRHAAACDLVVMGTHGRRGLPRLFMGSNAERVARLSPVPVLLVRQAAAADHADSADTTTPPST